MNNLIIIKLGGSSITKKEENKFEINYLVLKQAAKELALALHKAPELKVALVCGVGPFGHTYVVKYDLNNGIKTREQEIGVEVTKKDCDFVGEEVKKTLEEQKLRVKFIPGYDVCVQDNKKLKSFDSSPYKKALEEGFIPLSTGVMVKDDSLGWSPMSGDVVIAQLTKQLGPTKVVIGTDVDGIFTSDPKINPKAELISQITKKNLANVLKKAGESKAMDVTGGMKGKLEKLAETLNGVPAEIFNLFVELNLEKSILDQEIKSTKLKL